MTIPNFVAIRERLLELPDLAAHSTGTRLDPSAIFFPPQHASALNPDVALVVGNRGMGKSFWAGALADPSGREQISNAYSSSHAGRLQNIQVFFGFADAEGAQGGLSRLDIEGVGASVPPEAIWRAELVRHLAPIAGIPVPMRFVDRVSWVRENLEGQQELFRAADRDLEKNGKRVLFLFDQLEQLASDWSRVQELTQGLLRTALAMKSYRSIRTKTFMRPDQFENRNLFRFPDASKVRGEATRLYWTPVDLYGLLFFEIWRTDSSREALRSLCETHDLNVTGLDKKQGIPEVLTNSESAQANVFAAIAGEFMGSNSKRGRPYTWIPVHLADAFGEISPRTFLKVMKAAAAYRPAPEGRSLDHNGIAEGVRQASENRLAELSEDYPWVSAALEPLRDLLVPCNPDEVTRVWKSKKVADAIVKRFSGTQAPLELTLTERDMGFERPENRLLTSLGEIGVLEERANGKINFPDIFRVSAGIRRKGGITPEQRRRFGYNPSGS